MKEKIRKDLKDPDIKNFFEMNIKESYKKEQELIGKNELKPSKMSARTKH